MISDFLSHFVNDRCFLTRFSFLCPIAHESETRNGTIFTDKFFFHSTVTSNCDVSPLVFHTCVTVLHFDRHCFGSWCVNDIIHYQLQPDQFPLRSTLQPITYRKSDVREFTRYKQYELIDLTVHMNRSYKFVARHSRISMFNIHSSRKVIARTIFRMFIYQLIDTRNLRVFLEFLWNNTLK